MRTILSSLAFLLILLSSSACRTDQSVDRGGEQVQATPYEQLINSPENRERDSWQAPQRVLDQLGDLSEKTVADLGAGAGYFTFRLLPRARKVIAIEIDDRYVRYLDEKVRSLPDSLQRRLETRLAEPEDPHLNEQEVDAVLVVNTYIYITDRYRYFQALRGKIKPGGTLLIVDYQKKPLKLGPPMEVKMAPHEVQAELLSAGYENIVVDNISLDYQYMIRATVPADSTAR